MTDGAVTAKGQQERTPAATTRPNGKGPRGMRRVRWSDAGDPEMQCARCFEFLPMTREFWAPVHGLASCRACRTESTKAYHRELRKDPAYREFERQKSAEYRRDHRQLARDWYRRNNSVLARYRRETAA